MKIQVKETVTKTIEIKAGFYELESYIDYKKIFVAWDGESANALEIKKESLVGNLEYTVRMIFPSATFGVRDIIREITEKEFLEQCKEIGDLISTYLKIE